MTTVNNYKSSTIRGLLKNSDYPDGSELANAVFDRSITVGNSLQVNYLIKSKGSIEVSFDNSGAEETIISLQNNGNINCKTINIIEDATINNNLTVVNDANITNNLNVTNDTTLSNNLNVNNDVIIGNNLTTGKLFLNDSDINSQGSNLNLICNNISSFFDVLGNFNCNHNMILNNNLSLTGSATISNNLTINNNLIVTGASGGNINCKSISISGTTLIDNNKDMTVHDLTTNKADINSILTVANVFKPSTTILPNLSVHLGFIHTISKVSIISTVTTTLTILQNINVNNTTFSYGTYRFKLFFSGSGSTSQTMTFCINTAQSLYANKNGKETTNANISTLQYDITLNIYTATSVYFLAQTNIGTYTINDAFIEMVRIA